MKTSKILLHYNNSSKSDKSLYPLTMETQAVVEEDRKAMNKRALPKELITSEVLYFDVRCRAIFPAEWYLSNFKNSEKTLTLCEVIPQTKECEKGKLAIKLVDTNLTAWNQRTIKLTHHQVHMYIYKASEIEQKDHLVYGKQRSMLQAIDEAPAVINIATYNANGLKNAIERGFLSQLPDNLDVLCIQETKGNSKLPTLSTETHLQHARFNNHDIRGMLEWPCLVSKNPYEKHTRFSAPCKIGTYFQSVRGGCSL